MSRNISSRWAKMSSALTDLDAELSAWCQSYVDAFNTEDASAIAAHWTFPALSTQAGRSFTFKSEEHFAKNTEILLGFYQAQSVHRVERALVSAQRLHRDTASMIVSDVMYTADGQEIAHWQAAYVLQRVDGTWKAVMAVADGETEAWAARGTPLSG